MRISLDFATGTAISTRGLSKSFVIASGTSLCGLCQTIDFLYEKKQRTASERRVRCFFTFQILLSTPLIFVVKLPYRVDTNCESVKSIALLCRMIALSNSLEGFWRIGALFLF